MGRRARIWVRQLLQSNSLSEVQEACLGLLDIVKLGSFAGDSLARSSAVPVLLAALRSCNLSRPHRRLASICLQLLQECVERSPACLHALAHAAEAADVLADAAQLYRDDPGGLLASSLRLLADAVAAKASARAGAGGGHKTGGSLATIVGGKWKLDESLRKRLCALKQALRRKLASMQQQGGASGGGSIGVRTRSQAKARRQNALALSPTRSECIRGLTASLSYIDDALHGGSAVSPIKMPAVEIL